MSGPFAFRNTLFAAAAAVVGSAFLGGCAQLSSPTSPSSSAASSVSATSSASESHVTVAGPPITPVWAQLNLATDLLASANHQLSLFLIQGPPIIPPNPVIPGNPVFPADQNALDFYLKANSVLDEVAVNGPPITPETTVALNAILGQANTTLTLFLLYDSPRPSLLFGQITTQAAHTTQVANTLLGF
jgi:hypothetical protein